MQRVQTTQEAVIAPLQSQAGVHATQAFNLLAYGPPASQGGRQSESNGLIAYSAGSTNVTTHVSQGAVLIAYATANPAVPRQSAWTFVMDGHRFYVLPLGPEGDWAYDTTTHEWCKLKSYGFDGLNFTHGAMWGIRVMGGDSLYPYLYEMDPTIAFDEGWREIKHVVTGGIPMRGRSVVGVANFSITASVSDDQAIDQPISLRFSDDNGATWSSNLDIALTDMGSQRLIWNSLGSFSTPGRIFEVTDTAGPVRLDGADAVLTIGSGADSGQDQEGQQHQ